MLVTPRFPLGRVLLSEGALELLSTDEVERALLRHAQGDWGDVNQHDAAANDIAVRDGERIISVYDTAGGKRFWIITEADRSCTTVVLPDEY